MKGSVQSGGLFVIAALASACGDVESTEPTAVCEEAVTCIGDPGPQGEQGPQGEPGPAGAPADPAAAIMNGTSVQTASFNIDGDGLVGGRLGIGTPSPTAKLSVGEPLYGTAMSSTLVSNAGALSSTVGSEISVASFGFRSANNSSFGIRARRIVEGNGWDKTSIGLGMDVDNTPRAGGASLWLASSGNIGVNIAAPTANLDVSGTVQLSHSSTSVMTVTPSGCMTITHNLGIPANKTQLHFISNGDTFANPFIVVGRKTYTANSFEVCVSGGSAALGRFDWVIFVK